MRRASPGSGATWRPGRRVTLLRYAPRRVDCAKCGVHVESVPWAAPESRFTRRMEELVAYLAQQMSKTAVCKLAGIDWRTVGSIVERIIGEKLDPTRLEPGVAARELEQWTGWATRSRLRPFVKLARTIKQFAAGFIAYVRTGLSNGPTEGLNNKARLITRRAYGYHSAPALIAMIFLCCGGITLSPPLPSPTGSP